MQPSNILQIPSLDSNWRDIDIVMLHACFSCLSIFVEEEDGLKYSISGDKDLIKEEIKQLYDWWQGRKNINWSELDNELEQLKIDDLMLIRLMKIRTHLWW